jgi:hypothetical protein
MEKNEMPIVSTSDIAAVASATAAVQAPVAASNVAANASAVALIQAPVAASNVVAGASATSASAAAPVQAPVVWDPYEDPYKPVSYITPENSYDTSIVDDEPEVTLCSLFLIPFQSFCVRSSVIRVRLFLV